ncbi:MAG: glycoside hydrolase family 3 N-terminal domain-containing protein, partial [Eubacteriales bacterium]
MNSQLSRAGAFLRFSVTFLLLPLTLMSCAATDVSNVMDTSVQSFETVTEAVETTAVETDALTPADELYATSLLAEMTLDQKVGQLFFARCPDIGAAADAAEYQLGGYILFGQDFKNKTADEVKAAIASYQDAVGIPMLIGVDEEGGTVCRVSRYTEFRAS